MKLSPISNVLKQIFIIAGVIVMVNTQAFAQSTDKYSSTKDRTEYYQNHVKLTQESVFKNLNWQFVGPTNTSGRMTDVEVVSPKGTNYTIYVAGATGGIWKTSNEGTTWEPIFEHAMSASIGDLALDPQNQNTIWAGTGEGNIFRSSNAGAGIYKSSDAGKTWEHKGLINTNTISRVLVHPKNSDIVYVAASGHEWTNNEDRGVYKTTDGGTTWNKILFINDETGAYDLVMDPNNPDQLYVTTWQRIRKKWNDPRNEDYYTGSGIHKTTDGGKTWKEINNGLPEVKARGRIGIDLCKTKPNVVYAFVDNYTKLPEQHELNTAEDSYGRPSSGRIAGATIYKSEDFGENWKQVSKEDTYMAGLSSTYGWVFGQIRVDPNDENKIYVMGLALNVSSDGGKSFKPLRGMHSDHHGLWIDPNNSNYLVNVNDGGIAISYDGENFKTFYDNLPLVQFFNVNYDMSEPFYVYGSIQDHGSRKGIVDLSRGRNKIPAVDFEYAPGGEGSNHQIDPEDPNIVYSAGFYGQISRMNNATGKQKNIMPKTPEGVDKLRGQWLAPFIISPHNSSIIYHGTQFIHRSMNKGESWEKISPDLTYNEDSKKGDIPYQTIFAISESPLKFGLIYAGTDDGRVWITKNSGTDWKEINKGVAENRWVSRMVASKYDEATVYMSQNGKRNDDWTPYLWKSVDYGETWTSIVNNIPSGPINVIREDPNKENILYVGTDYGVYVSLDKGEVWQSLPGNLPTTYVHDLVIHPRDNIMVIATHGRGIWAMDINHIYDYMNVDQEKACNIIDLKENPMLPRGTNYWYRNTAKNLYLTFNLKEEVKIEYTILDAKDKKVFAFKGTMDKGLNFIDWNLRTEGENGELVKDGNYTIVIKGKGFKEQLGFTVDKFHR